MPWAAAHWQRGAVRHCHSPCVLQQARLPSVRASDGLQVRRNPNRYLCRLLKQRLRIVTTDLTSDGREKRNDSKGLRMSGNMLR